MADMSWVWLSGIALWTLACSALLAAFATFDRLWFVLFAGGAGVTLVWLGAAVVLSARRRWNAPVLLLWAAWPVAVGIVALLHATDLPMTMRVVASRGALDEFVASNRTRGRVGLVWVFDVRRGDGCTFLQAGVAFDGITGLVHAPDGS